MKRPETRHDRFPGFHRAAQANTVAGRLAAIDAALAAGIGHKLFTALVVNHAKGENQRYYSNQPTAYPVGGSKPINAVPSTHREGVMAGECRFLNDYAELSAAFADHALIRSLGCESCVNVPVRWNGQTIGMINLLHEAHWYSPSDVPELQIHAALAAPAFLEIIGAW